MQPFAFRIITSFGYYWYTVTAMQFLTNTNKYIHLYLRARLKLSSNARWFSSSRINTERRKLLFDRRALAHIFWVRIRSSNVFLSRNYKQRFGSINSKDISCKPWSRWPQTTSTEEESLFGRTVCLEERAVGTALPLLDKYNATSARLFHKQTRNRTTFVWRMQTTPLCETKLEHLSKFEDDAESAIINVIPNPRQIAKSL